MSAGAWALVGVGVGAILGFVSSQLASRLQRRLRGRSAARLIWAELARNEAIAAGAREFGSSPSPVHPRLVFWETHAAAVAEVVHPDVLIDLEVAYGYVEMLSSLLTLTLSGSEAEFRDGAAEIQKRIKDGRDALLPYAARQGIAEVLRLRRASLPEPVEPISDPGASV